MNDATLTHNGLGFTVHSHSKVTGLATGCRMVTTVTDVWHDGAVIGTVAPNLEGTRWVASYEPFGRCGTFNDKSRAIREVIERWAAYQAHQARQHG